MADHALYDAPYISLRTYRKSGVAVDTPVWMVHENGDFYIFSAGHAGKVKRIRANGKCQLAVCNATGKLLGDWHDAQAELVSDQDTINNGLQLLGNKYGWQMWLANIGARMTGKFNKRAYIRVRLSAD